MDDRQALALLIAVLTAFAVAAVLFYVTRERRAERRAQIRGERFRRRKNDERIRAAGDGS